MGRSNDSTRLSAPSDGGGKGWELRGWMRGIAVVGVESVAGGAGGVAIHFRDDLLVRLAQVLVGIHRDVVNADLVMEVGAGGAAGLANVADDFAAGDVLAGNNGEGR